MEEMSHHQAYTEFHRKRLGEHLYPTEFLVRTMLGRYPHLNMTREYQGKDLLDLGFGDGRNFLLFHNLGLRIHGAEPDPELCALVDARAKRFDISADLRQGSNASIPYPDATFDFVVASHSIYYVNTRSFDDNVTEVARVMRPGAWLIATFPDLENSALRDAEEVQGLPGHWRLTADPFGLRNGSVFRAFASEREIVAALEPRFESFNFARFRDDWYGLLVSGFVCVCTRKVM